MLLCAVYTYVLNTYRPLCVIRPQGIIFMNMYCRHLNVDVQRYIIQYTRQTDVLKAPNSRRERCRVRRWLHAASQCYLTSVDGQNRPQQTATS